jgi:predicted DNA binding CopG/RHH family protein
MVNHESEPVASVATGSHAKKDQLVIRISGEGAAWVRQRAAQRRISYSACIRQIVEVERLRR